MDTLLLIFLLLLPIVLLLTSPSHKNLPPGPFAWPIIGNLHAKLGRAPHVVLTELAKAHGPLMRVQFGWQPVIVASTREAAAEVLRRHDKDFSARYVPHSMRFKDHLQYSLAWSDCTETWKAMRRIIRAELFSTKMLQIQAPNRERKAAELVAYLGLREGSVVKLTDVVFGTILNMFGQVVFSKDVFDYDEGSEKVGIRRLTKELLALGTSPNIADFYPILGGLDLQGLQRASEERFKQFNALLGIIIEERKKCRDDGEKKHDFLQVLLDNGLNDAQIHAMFLETFGPGSESSSVTIEWTMAELIKNPDKMSKVVAELDEVVGLRCNTLKEAHLPQLFYLQACIKESLRLHPPGAFLLPRRTTETCTDVMGYTIPKDCQILVNNYAIGRDPANWADPLTFAPERFLSSDVDFYGNHMEFTPFGAGRRICVGLPLATRTIPLILASLLHSFDWTLPGGASPQDLVMNEKLSLTLCMDPPLLVWPKLRPN